jgi:hypothetical protein
MRFNEGYSGIDNTTIAEKLIVAYIEASVGDKIGEADNWSAHSGASISNFFAAIGGARSASDPVEVETVPPALIGLPKPPSWLAVFREWQLLQRADQFERDQNSLSLPRCGITWSTHCDGLLHPSVSQTG